MESMWSKELTDWCQQRINEEEEATKQVQIAAIRVRLLDLASGASGTKVELTTILYHPEGELFYAAVASVFGVHINDVEDHGMAENTIVSLAAWLWERGVRA